MSTALTVIADGTASAEADPAVIGCTTSGRPTPTNASTDPAPAGGAAYPSTIAPLTPSEQRRNTVRSALLLGRLLSISAHRAGMISRSELDSHTDAFEDAERALGQERWHG